MCELIRDTRHKPLCIPKADRVPQPVGSSPKPQSGLLQQWTTQVIPAGPTDLKTGLSFFVASREVGVSMGSFWRYIDYSTAPEWRQSQVKPSSYSPNFMEQTAHCDHKPRAAWVYVRLLLHRLSAAGWAECMIHFALVSFFWSL